MGKFTLDQGFGGEQWLRKVALHLASNNEIIVLTSDRGSRNTQIRRELSANSNIHTVEVKWKERSKFAADFKQNLGSIDSIYILDSPFKTTDMIHLFKLYSETRCVKGNHTPLSVENNLPRLSLPIRVYFSRLKPFLLRAYKECTLQHVLNEDDLKFCEKKQLPARLIYNGVEAHQHSLPKFKKFTILVAGRMNYQKGTMKLIELFNVLKMDKDKFDVIIIGEGQFRKKLEKNLQHNMKMKGFVDESRKVEYFGRSHVLVVLSRWEAYPFTVVEALGFGMPVVSFDIAGVRDVIRNGKNGFLVKNIKELANRIEYFYENSPSEEYRKFKENCLDSVQGLRWDLIKEDIEEMIVGSNETR